MSSSCSARITRTAISPRFATSTRSNTSSSDRWWSEDGLELEQQLAVLDGLPVLDVDRADDSLGLRLELVEELHGLEDAENLSGNDGVADVDERRSSRGRSAIEDTDHRRLDTRDAVRRARRDARSLGAVGIDARGDGQRQRGRG